MRTSTTVLIAKTICLAFFLLKNRVMVNILLDNLTDIGQFNLLKFFNVYK